MPLSFYFGISALVVIVAVWVIGMLVMRARRRKSGRYGPLDSVDDSEARQQLAGGRDAVALAMAVRGAQNRQGR
jgi:hypothetical protein